MRHSAYAKSALGSMPPLGDAYGSGKGPGRRLSPRRGPRCPTSTFGGSRSGAMVKHPLEHSSSSACQSIRVLRGELLVKDPSDEGLKPASQSLTLGLHSFARLRAENISPVFARPGRSSLQRPE
jgi:hypothetical protein